MNARSTLICDCYYIPLLVLTHLWPCCARGPRSLLIKLPPKTTAPLRRTNLYIKNNAFNNEMTKIKYFPIVTVTVIHPTMGTSAKAVELWGGYIYNTEVQYKSYRKQYWNKNHMRWHIWLNSRSVSLATWWVLVVYSLFSFFSFSSVSL